MRKAAPGPSAGASAIESCPPWASTIRLAIARPRPVPLALVVKKGSKILVRCFGGIPGPLSRMKSPVQADRPARRRWRRLRSPPAACTQQGHCRRGCQRPAQAETGRRRNACRCRRAARAGTPPCPCARAPRASKQRASTAARSHTVFSSLIGRRVTAHVFVKVVEMVLGFLEALDQLERLQADRGRQA